MPKDNAAMQDCIETCRTCHDECQATFFNHCLQQGGKHVEPEHVKLMVDCISICQQTADFMARGSNMHAFVCEACARICEACVKSCESIDGAEMRRCAEACRACADSCRQMSRPAGKAA